ncbi:DUF3592 domain-containing protein [Streptomyces indicus]|uniref:DUF3592 domain-containing protein n=1 Tax=Streptomyces indicus TaxID=417292 RepID=A0A1G8Z841_9ACTN|nr:DUF3592 domain-containing protein [Streptomyces indicus]SDK10585.1 hypothetical protein SAMN05421806_104465 [Streptomyces indicus]
MVVLAALTALGGLVALLAGAYGLWQTRRLAAAGEAVTALVKPAPQGAERPLLQFVTLDGRVMEVPSPVPPSRRLPLRTGTEVRIAYDPGDPRAVLLPGSERIRLDQGFVAAGAALVVLGAVLAVTLG